MLEIKRKNDFNQEILPSLGIADEINRSLKKNPLLVITAPPGAGKSTALPISIYNALEQDGKILMLEPRRIAARQIAERMAYHLDEKVGESIGYRIRFETRVSPATRIEVLTEGILTGIITSDPTLEGVKAIIFDEFHERSLSSDLALSLVRETFRTIRPDLRIIIMSATIDAATICSALSAPLIESTGKTFPVNIVHAEKDSTEKTCYEDVARAVLKYHNSIQGDILAFLPGESEIKKCFELLQTADLGNTSVYPLYGLLPKEQQRRAISPSPGGERKIVLATPIAETSITIEGVTIVIDSGFYKKSVFDTQNSLSHLETVRISMDMARQRSGRAGRTAPGVCFRLWTTATERRLRENRVPEIIDADLSPALLEIALWGESRPEDMLWLTPPPAHSLSLARKTLLNLGAIDSDGRITPLGKRIAGLPCHPRVANMLLSASTPEERSLATDIAALLEEKDIVDRLEVGTDICVRINKLRNNRKHLGHLSAIAGQYRSIIGAGIDDSVAAPYSAGSLIAHAFPERIAQSCGCGRFLTAGGETVRMDIGDSISSCEYLAVATMSAHEGSVGTVFLAAPVDMEDLDSLFSEREIVCWDKGEGKVIARRETRIGTLSISSKPIENLERTQVLSAVCDAAPKEGLSMFEFSGKVQNLQRRIALVSSWAPQLELPEVSTQAMLDRVREWLPVYGSDARTASDLKRIDMASVIWNTLTWDQKQAVDRLAPAHITVPSGSSIPVEYRTGAEFPVLKVRLQECFGLTDTPRVNDGKTPVLMDLLSPGFKSVQLTSDLRSFWTGTYFDVRKELRLRYPKHSWPENPLEAEAVRGVQKKH